MIVQDGLHIAETHPKIKICSAPNDEKYSAVGQFDHINHHVDRGDGCERRRETACVIECDGSIVAVGISQNNLKTSCSIPTLSFDRQCLECPSNLSATKPKSMVDS